MYKLESSDGAVIFSSGDTKLRLEFVTPAAVRVTFTERRPFGTKASVIVTGEAQRADFSVVESESCWSMRTALLTIEVRKETGALRFLGVDGNVRMQEPARGGKWLTRKPVYRNVFHNEDGDRAESLEQSVDGARAAATNYETVLDREAFEAKLEFVFAEDEALFGLGSHEEGYGNLRGRTRELYQQNMKAVVPCLVSTRGYGVLVDCGSLMTFRDDALGSYWWADVVDELDYYVFVGDTFDDLMNAYRQLTGASPMPPKWMFGYAQSKERYVNAAEMLEVVRQYRARAIPLDTIVLDWKSWPNGSGWGQKSFDPARFPDPAGFTQSLHDEGARLMISIWPIMTGECENQRDLQTQGMMLGNRSTYNALLPAAREAYWQQANRGLFAYGIDAWWCDCTEPFEADWAGAVKPEPHARLLLNTGQSKLYMDAAEINLFSLLHSRGIYEGQRATGSGKRVVNLTRSSYAGQHRYGTITWNGDICATWETLRRCIPEGLNFCATGEPYWSVDIGGFFVNYDAAYWFWHGDYPGGTRGLTPGDALEPDPLDRGSTDIGFHELYTRWLQYATFLPMMRSHGTDVAREIWRFGEPGNQFYDTIAEYIRLRYRLIPYIYSLAAEVTRCGSAMMRAVALEFPHDAATHSITDQYLFGHALLVCPVTHAMYFGPGSTALADAAKTRAVYLPAGSDWIDFWSGEKLRGGQEIEAEAPLEQMPLYARAGSIVPLGQVMQYVDQVRNAPHEIRVFCGADATFTLYEDAGDGYEYESGESATVVLEWSEAAGELSIASRRGAFQGMVAAREFNVAFYAGGESERHTVLYKGDALTVTKGHSKK